MIDFLLSPFGMYVAGIVMIATGGWVLINGMVGMSGGCKASLTWIRYNMYFSIVQILLALACLGLVLSSTLKEDKLRLQWSHIPEEKRQVIETKMLCCGYDDTSEGVEGCKFKKSCSEFIPTAYKKRAGTAAAACAAGLLAGAVSLFGSACLQRKLGKQEGKSKKKNFTSLQDQARGIDKTTRPQRPPRPSRGHDAA